MKNPIRNQQDEFFRLQEKSNKIVASLNGHALSRVEAKMAYESFYIPAMRYFMSITSAQSYLIVARIPWLQQKHAPRGYLLFQKISGHWTKTSL
jgi:hypothetical protein